MEQCAALLGLGQARVVSALRSRALLPWAVESAAGAWCGRTVHGVRVYLEGGGFPSVQCTQHAARVVMTRQRAQQPFVQNG